MQRSALCRSRRELSNAYLLAKFGFDTAENEPSQVCPIEQCSTRERVVAAEAAEFRAAKAGGMKTGPAFATHGRLGCGWNRVRGLGSAKLGKLANFCKFLAGSFSAVSKRNFARKYAFDSIFQALQDLHTFAPLQSQMFSKKSV